MAISPLYGVDRVEPVTIGDGIPALLVRPRGLGPWPAVLIQHGYGPADKSHLLPLATFLAERGFVSLLPDAWGHGERFPASGPNWMTELSADYFLEVLRHTVEGLEVCLDALAARADVRGDMVVAGGFSLGAMAALLLGTRDTRVAGVVSVSGSAAADLVDLSIMGARPAGPAARAWALEHDAALRLGRLAPRPLLLQHGRPDDLVPVANTLRLYEVAQPLYAEHPERLGLMLYDHAHTVTPRQIDDAVEWMGRMFAA